MRHCHSSTKGWIFAALSLFIFFAVFSGCGRSGKHALPGNNPPDSPVTGAPAPVGPGRISGAPALKFTSEAQGDVLHVQVTAINAADLYQMGGRLKYDSSALEFLAMSPGDSFGKPDERFEFAGVRDGDVEFAISKRYAGPGANGTLTVAVFRFRIVNSGGDLEVSFAESPVVRDSKKANLDMNAGGGAE